MRTDADDLAGVRDPANELLFVHLTSFVHAMAYSGSSQRSALVEVPPNSAAGSGRL
jgi:hypothetical protein